ncbi:MAG TPA: response regulator [Syntrophorhabdaceae bacterium]|nr:response regulator [Syntrophorhabdaceae bacterium]
MQKGVTFVANRVLIIDDDEKLRKLLGEYLKDHGFHVRCLADGVDVPGILSTDLPDLVILDIMLPGKDGLEVLKEVRKDYGRLPVIMLTARGDDTDRIVGLELGADDYLPKPFNPRELLARIKAVLRRSIHSETDGDEQIRHTTINAAGISLNTAKQTVTVEGREMELSTAEFRILEVLMKNPNTVMSRDQLMTLARGRDFTAFDRSIDVHISKLRSKVEVDPGAPRRIKTIWGTGYMLVDSR